MRWRETMIYAGTGLAVGALNGLFGAGGGIVAVVLLGIAAKYAEKCGVAGRNGDAARRAHATSIALIFPISILSAWMYISGGSVVPGDIAAYIPGGILGAALGAALLKIISPKWLKRVFALFMLYTSYRLMFG